MGLPALAQKLSDGKSVAIWISDHEGLDLDGSSRLARWRKRLSIWRKPRRTGRRGDHPIGCSEDGLSATENAGNAGNTASEKQTMQNEIKSDGGITLEMA